MKNTNFLLESLFQKGKIIELVKGEVLHSPLDTCKAIGFIKNGKLRLSRTLSTGKEIYINQFETGDVFGEMIVFSAEKYPGWLTAVKPTTVIELDLKHLLIHLQNSEALISFFRGISHKITELTNTIEILSQKTIKQKIAHYLIVQSRPEPNPPISVSNLAKRLGCSREALSRALSELAGQNMISREKDSITMTKQSLLEEILYSD